MGEVSRAAWRTSAFALAVACATATACETRSNAPSTPATTTTTTTTTTSATTTPTATPTPTATATATATTPALASLEPVVPLEVPGFAEAIVSLPLGARGPKPVVVALHGNYDRPEWQCGTWRPIVGDRAFVLCPRGVARRDSPSKDDIRFTYTNGAAAYAELDAALAALRARWGAFVDPGPMIWIGFSLGAILAAGYVLRDAARFPRMVLIEGGEGGWGEKKFADAGGQRVLWGCGQAGCVGTAKAMAARFERVRVPSKVVYGKGEGHSYTGTIADGVKAEWEWLVEGDPRWSK